MTGSLLFSLACLPMVLSAQTLQFATIVTDPPIPMNAQVSVRAGARSRATGALKGAAAMERSLRAAGDTSP